jgi:hypothetical protein
MFRTILSVLALLLVACAPDQTSTVIAIHPSAVSKAADIIQAVEDLNTAIGAEVFTVIQLEGYELIEGAAVVRLVERLAGDETVAGRTFHRAHSLDIVIEPETKPRIIAHELCHAAGLEHVEDDSNLMFYAPLRVALAATQREYLLGLVP